MRDLELVDTGVPHPNAKCLKRVLKGNSKVLQSSTFIRVVPSCSHPSTLHAPFVSTYIIEIRTRKIHETEVVCCVNIVHSGGIIPSPHLHVHYAKWSPSYRDTPFTNHMYLMRGARPIPSGNPSRFTHATPGWIYRVCTWIEDETCTRERLNTGQRERRRQNSRSEIFPLCRCCRSRTAISKSSQDGRFQSLRESKTRIHTYTHELCW